MDQQELRNALSRIEDRARAKRNALAPSDGRLLFSMVAELAQLVRQGVVDGEA